MPVNTRSGKEVPVGAILSYAGLDTTQLPWNWVLCDGGQLTTSIYPGLAAVLMGTLDSYPQQFSLPDLQGRFLRGSIDQKAGNPNPMNNPVDQTVLVAGKVFDGKTARDPSSEITVEFLTMPNNEEDNVMQFYGDGSKSMMRWANTPSDFSVSSDASETRPDNVYLHFIIKAAPLNATPPENWKVAAANIPVAAIVPYAGMDGLTPGTAPDWIACTGQPEPIDESKQLQTLQNVTQGRFTPPNTPENQYIPPDLRGMFLRGTDASGSVDKDHTSRNPAPNGDTQGLGTWQPWSTFVNNARISIPYWNSRSDSYQAGSGNYHIANDHYSSSQIWRGGGQETRPNNAAVSYFINSQSDDTKSEVPVGCIIAVIEPSRSQTVINTTYWRYCDGDDTFTEMFVDLKAALDSVWGPGATDQQFAIPNLESQFLRASSSTGAAYGRDPDSQNRTAYLQPTKQSTGTGTFQKWATARPESLKVPGFSYATANNNNPTSLIDNDHTNNLPHWSNDRSYAVLFTDNETAPACCVVNFYIRVF